MNLSDTKRVKISVGGKSPTMQSSRRTESPTRVNSLSLSDITRHSNVIDQSLSLNNTVSDKFNNRYEHFGLLDSEQKEFFPVNSTSDKSKACELSMNLTASKSDKSRNMQRFSEYQDDTFSLRRNTQQPSEDHDDRFTRRGNKPYFEDYNDSFTERGNKRRSPEDSDGIFPRLGNTLHSPDDYIDYFTRQLNKRQSPEDHDDFFTRRENTPQSHEDHYDCSTRRGNVPSPEDYIDSFNIRENKRQSHEDHEDSVTGRERMPLSFEVDNNFFTHRGNISLSPKYQNDSSAGREDIPLALEDYAAASFYSRGNGSRHLEDDYDIFTPRRNMPRALEEDEEDSVKKNDPPKLSNSDFKSLKKILFNWEFYLRVHNNLFPDKTFCLFGEISIKIKDFEKKFQMDDLFWLFVNRECDKSFIYFNKNIKKDKSEFQIFHVVGNLDIQFWYGLREKAHFQLVFHKIENNILHFKLYFLKSGLVNIIDTTDFPKGNYTLPLVCSRFYPASFKAEQNSHTNIDDFYKCIREAHQGKNYCNLDVQHTNLILRLRPYQKLAVKWMLYQEKFGEKNGNCKMDPAYIEITSLDNKKLYYNKFGKFFVKEKPLEKSSSSCLGGILADEMGLGKTLELLACIMCNLRPNSGRGEAICNISLLDYISDVKKHEFIRKPTQNFSEDKTLDFTSDEDSDIDYEPYNKIRYISMDETADSKFLCTCGRSTLLNDLISKSKHVQCSICRLKQHAHCVKFQLHDSSMGKYVCPRCWPDQELVTSGATIIVTPSAISHQWIDEIGKHIKGNQLQVFFYHGIAKGGYIQPKTLARYDIVITTYDILRNELTYADLPTTDRRLRYRKCYMTPPSPLPCIEWWRICLDEAQMVEVSHSRPAKMAQRLKGVNRWCITGTPIQKSLKDLQGLFLFLNVTPYNKTGFWNRFKKDPFVDSLHRFMSRYMWRTCKEDVVDELDLPLQSEKVHWLNFTYVEEQFYNIIRTKCASEILKKLNNIEDRKKMLSSLDKQSFSNLMQPLLNLRQACNHPQIVKGPFLDRSISSQEQIVEYLLTKTRIDAEETHQMFVSSLNGLAGLDIIRGNYRNATEKYLQVLKFSKLHQNDIKTDPLIKLHAIHNLLEIFNDHNVGIKSPLQYELLQDEKNNIRANFLLQYANPIKKAKLQCTRNLKTLEEVENVFNLKMDWWIMVVEIIDRNVIKYKNCWVYNSLFDSFKSKDEVISYLRLNLETLHNQRQLMVSKMREILNGDHDIILQGAINCHLRSRNITRCALCVADDHFEAYKTNLFEEDRKTRMINENLEKRVSKKQVFYKTTWHFPGILVSKISEILKYLQKNMDEKVDSKLIEDSKTHIAVLHYLRKEFMNFRLLWSAVYDFVSALDELKTIVQRYRLCSQDEDALFTEKKATNCIDELDKKLVLKVSAIPIMEKKLEREKFSSCEQFREKFPNFLKLKENCNNIQNGENLASKSCSKVANVRDYFSTKVEGVVIVVLKIISEDSDAKVLIVSCWNEILNLIGRCLAQHGVSHRILHKDNKYQENLSSFKNDCSITALLLNSSSGTKGLNLTEAQHIILVEPILNPGIEFQAIGRIHRIGQTRPTVVHRIIMRNTIEESILTIIHPKYKNVVKGNPITIDDLYQLFVNNK